MYMDLELVERGLDFPWRKKKWIIILGLLGFSSYGAYKVYNLPSVVWKRRRLERLLRAFVSVAEMVSDSADAFNVVSKDLKEFLQSNSDEMPNSLKQLSKIARSYEFSRSLTRVTEAMTIGVLRGYRAQTRSEIDELGKPDFTDRLLDKLTSTAGTGFVSAVVGSFARNLVLGFTTQVESRQVLEQQTGDTASQLKSNSSAMAGWLQLLSDDKCKVLIADCIQKFVSTAVAVYLDKTMSINFYDEIFSGLTNPKHQAKVQDILVSLCNGAVETLVKTSHQVLTASKSNSAKNPDASHSLLDKTESSLLINGNVSNQEDSRKINETNEHVYFQNSGWVNNVSSTLAVPSNRKFVLDVTGRVTSETIRSLVEFFYWKFWEVLERSISTVRQDSIERGLEVMRYLGAKSSVILTICVALFLHILDGTRFLLPA